MSFVTTNGLQKTLFKKILLSHFPKKVPTRGLQPTNTFVSFISAKQFFSIVTRKVVENYKLNYFDIALDPFELKIGFGDYPSIKVKNIEDYYAYCSAANMNGNKLYTPGSIGNTLAMFSSSYLYAHFDERENKQNIHLYMYLLTSVYLISYVFFGKIKVFPYHASYFTDDSLSQKQKDTARQENFNRFVEVFFNFYQTICQQAKTTLSKATLGTIKKNVLKESGLFFFLYETYLNANRMFDVYYGDATDVYTQLLGAEEADFSQKVLINNYISHALTYRTIPRFNKEEKYVITLLMPTDFLTKYVFTEQDAFLSSQYIFNEVFDHKVCDPYLQGFIENGENLELFLGELMSYQNMKQSFFVGMEKMLSHRFDGTNKDFDNIIDEEDDEDIMSIIGMLDEGKDDYDLMDNGDDYNNVPLHIKEESATMERLLNFYITLIGGCCVSRGDSGCMRFFKQNFFRDVISADNIIGSQKAGLEYFGGLLYLYTKNGAYYKHIHENIRRGKTRFNIPYKSSLKKIKSNMLLMQSFDQNFIATLLQDIVPSDIKIYIKHGKILDFFQKKYGTTISQLVNLDKKDFLHQVYQPLHALLRKKTKLLPSIQKYFTDKDVRTIKSSLYSLDFRLMQTVYVRLLSDKTSLRKGHGDMSLMGMLSAMRDTLLGCMLYLSYVERQTLKETKNKEFARQNVQRIILLYCNTVIGATKSHRDVFANMLYDMHNQYTKIFAIWTKMDDNELFFSFAYDNRKLYSKNQTLEHILKTLPGEDILRFRGYLKNATFYNKRYLIPSYKV